RAVAETNSIRWNVSLRPSHKTAGLEIDRRRKAARTSAIARRSIASAGSRDPLPDQECAAEKGSRETDKAAICSTVAPAAWVPADAERRPLRTTCLADDRSKGHAPAPARE